MSSLKSIPPVNTLTFNELLGKIRSHSSKSLIETTFGNFLKVNLRKDRRVALKTNSPNLANHPFTFFLHILCYLEAQVIDFSNIHCIYLDSTGSFISSILQRRFPKALKSILRVSAIDGLPDQDIPTKPTKFTFLFADSLFYKRSLNIENFDAAIFWSSKEEEMGSHEILKPYNPPNLFKDAL